MEKFKNIYIIGAGKVAKECQKITQDYFNQEIIYLNDLNDLNDFFKNIKNCLIISANNFYIFKRMYSK